MPVLISFWTKNWLYEAHSQRLKKECEHYGLEHDIRELSGTDWMSNTRLKAPFIRQMLDEYKEICWVDVDSTILSKPNLFKRSMKADVMLIPHTTLPRHWHVSVMCFRRRVEVLKLLDKWVELATSGTDEAAFEQAWITEQPRVSYRRLPAEYHALPIKQKYPTGTVIGMGLSLDDSKLEMKARKAIA